MELDFEEVERITMAIAEVIEGSDAVSVMGALTMMAASITLVMEDKNESIENVKGICTAMYESFYEAFEKQ